MNLGSLHAALAAAVSVATVAGVAIAADWSGNTGNTGNAVILAQADDDATKKLLESKRREISPAEAADRAEAAAKGGGDNKKANEISPAEAADRAAAAKAKAEAAASGKGASAPAGNRTLAEAVKAAKGTLKNPYTDNKQAIAEGKQLYLDYSCNGCHGGTGGGGMCPPLTNERFVYGSDDDTIFRLIAIGSDELMKAGYSRIAREAVVGPMPPYVEIIENEDELWKIIAFVRSVYRGRAEKRDW